MIEPLVALHWLNSVLVPDSVLSTGLVGGWHEIAPAGVRYPFGIARQETASADQYGLDNGGLIWVPMTFQANVYERDKDNYSRIGPLADRVYELLQGGIATTADGIIYSCYRTKVQAGIQTIGDLKERYINQNFTIEAVGE